MKEQVIPLETHDDVTSTLDKLAWIRAPRVLLVFPDDPDHPILQRRLDLLLIQREATRRRAHLALVTLDSQVADHARELGIPCFPTVEATHRRQWKTERARLRLPRPPRPAPTSAGARLPAVRPVRRGLPRALAVAFFALSGVGLLVGVYVALPSATIYMAPAATPATVTAQITADPEAPAVDVESAVIPARIIGVEVEDTASQETTGRTDQPSEAATGVVVFSNLVPDQVTVPAGTIVRTTAADPVRFATLTDVTLPATVGATVEAPVEAVEPGVEANLPSGRINEVEGALAGRLAVTNPEPTRGGDIAQVAAVSYNDYQNLREMLLEQLQERAYAEMQYYLGQTEFMPRESLAVVLIQSETCDRYIGEVAETFSLTMRVIVQGVAIDESYANEVVYVQMAGRVGDDYCIQPDSLLFRRGEVLAIDEERRVSFIMQGSGDVVAAIDPARVQALVRGRTIRDAQFLLEQTFPLASPPQIELWLPFWPQMPVLPFRITVVVG
jgi:hypothetical protein